MIYLTLVALAQAALILALLADRRAERREHNTERAELLQRIQAPQLAIQAHELQRDPEPSPTPIGIDDDEPWQTREQLAEALSNGRR